MPAGAYADMFWCLWATAIALSLTTLAVAALAHVPYPAFDPTAHYTFPA